MFKNSIWKNPVGWGMNIVKGGRFWALVFMHVFSFITLSLSFILIFRIINKVFIKCLGHQFEVVMYSVVYALPLLALGVIFPLCYLYALKMISKELKNKNSYPS